MRAYKFTALNGVGMFTGFPWPPPASGNPGAWVEVGAEAVACHTGVHACRIADLPYWLAPELWEVELAGDILESDHKVVASRGRLVGRVDGWPEAERDFAEDCAARTKDLAVSELRRAGLDRHADAVETAVTTAELSEAVATVHPAEAGDLAATLAGYAVDASMDIDNGYLAMCAYVAASAFANQSTADVVQDMTAPGWVEERARQAAWLQARLSL